MPGRHVTDCQMGLYMHLRQHNGPRASAAKAGFGTATAYRVEDDPRLPSTRKKPRGRRRPDPLAGIFDEEIVPMLEQAADLRTVGIFEELMCRHPELDHGVRRTLERRVREWRALHGPERDLVFRQTHPPGQLGLSDFTDAGGLRVRIAGEPLGQRALALGWPADRAGFQRLVTDVGLGRAGIVMGLEVSRLARNNADWHRLLEICALADTLILDEDGIYDPAHFNDRLLLGLNGTMSEAELHLLRARLIGGMMNKARRGLLRCRLPIGFVYDARGRVALDPDRQVRQAVRLLFETFRRVGSATATVREFRRERLRFPQSVRSGPRSGEVVWGELGHHRALWILHHPRYAGAFCYGRSRQRKRGDGVRYRRLPREEWIALIPDAHAGYIAWDEFDRNERRLRDNSPPAARTGARGRRARGRRCCRDWRSAGSAATA